jgi:hypothetical protein
MRTRIDIVIGWHFRYHAGGFCQLHNPGAMPALAPVCHQRYSQRIYMRNSRFPLAALGTTFAILLATAGLAGCDKPVDNAGKGPAEIAGKQIDKAAVEAGKELKSAAQKTGEVIEQAGAKLQEKAKEAQK